MAKSQKINLDPGAGVLQAGLFSRITYRHADPDREVVVKYGYWNGQRSATCITFVPMDIYQPIEILRLKEILIARSLESLQPCKVAGGLLHPGQLYQINYRDKSVSPDERKDETLEGRWIGEIDAWGKFTIRSRHGDTYYLFGDEMLELEALPDALEVQHRVQVNFPYVGAGRTLYSAWLAPADAIAAILENHRQGYHLADTGLGVMPANQPLGPARVRKHLDLGLEVKLVVSAGAGWTVTHVWRPSR